MKPFKCYVDLGEKVGFFVNSVMDFTGELREGEIVTIPFGEQTVDLEIVAIGKEGENIIAFTRMSDHMEKGVWFKTHVLCVWQRATESFLGQIFGRQQPQTV